MDPRSKWQTDEHPGVYRHASTGEDLRDGREAEALMPIETVSIAGVQIY
jgi:hypothetical protein